MENLLTLKALANVSPGFALKPWGSEMFEELFCNPEGVAHARQHDHQSRSLSYHPPHTRFLISDF
jgi:hypothetical protein